MQESKNRGDVFWIVLIWLGALSLLYMVLVKFRILVY